MSFRPWQAWNAVSQARYRFRDFFQRREYVLGVVIGLALAFGWVIKAIFFR